MGSLRNIAIAALAAASPAGLLAQQPLAAPSIAPAPAWVEPVPVPAPNPALKAKPLQLLLLDGQGRYSADGGEEFYVHIASVVQTPEGLAAAANVAIPWQPERTDLIVHKVVLVRDGKPIDLLKSQQFMVLRRENNLEAATLDGILTAVLQPEGLAVGDVVDVAWTTRLKPGGLKVKAEEHVVVPHGMPVRRLRMRELWDAGMPIRWTATPALGKLAERKVPGGRELVLDLPDAESPELPGSLPSRFAEPMRLELSGYSGWQEISALLAPAYEKARQIAPDGALAAEAKRIAAASADPKARAMAALRLVEDKVRYLALAMGDAGLIPASADQTWTRKFGDCKGKTATLLALLGALGIEAEPVLVHHLIGDSLPDRLPELQAFDHVIVRAKIAGQSYWLDGTGNGDRSLADLASSPFGYGLPIRSAGAALEKLPLAPPEQPIVQANFTYDASKGFETPVPVTGRLVYRGDNATVLRLLLAQAEKKEVLKQILGSSPYAPDWSEIAQSDAIVDEEAGTVTLTYAGKTLMDWPKAPGGKASRFRFEDSTIRWNVDLKRPDGPFKSAPFVFEFPSFLDATETVILPRGGAGFTLDGHDFDRTLAGVRISRSLTLRGDRAVAHASFRRLQKEVSAAEATAAVAGLDEVNADRAWIVTPQGYAAAPAEHAAALALEPTTADEYNVRGYHRMQDDLNDQAAADFAKAAELSPRWARPLGNLALAYLHEGKVAEARAALDKAARLNAQDWVLDQARGVLDLEENRPDAAAEDFTRALARDPANRFTLGRRAEAYAELERFADAATDVEAALALDPKDTALLASAARLAMRRGQPAEALARADAVAALDTGWPEGALLKASIFQQLGRKEEAARTYAAALAAIDKVIAAEKDPKKRREYRIWRGDVLGDSGRTSEAVAALTAELAPGPDRATILNERCWARAAWNVELDLALADCDEALKADPQDAQIVDSRALVELRQGRLDAAIADYSAAIARQPKQAESWYGRGLARLRKGDRAEGEKDLATARRLDFDVSARYKVYGLEP